MQAAKFPNALERPKLDPQVIAAAVHKGRVLRAEAFMQLCIAGPARWLRSRVDAARRAAGAPLVTGA